MKTAVLLLFAGMFANAFALQMGASFAQGVTARGEADIMTKPDQFEIHIGVTTQSTTAELAGSQNAKQTDAVMAAIKKTLGATGEVKTASYSVNPNYVYRPNSSPTISGYIANNTVEVKSTDLTLAGKVIDAATKAGANTIHGINFTVKDEQAVRAKALSLAAQKAKQNAQAMATGLGLKLGPVISLSDGEPVQVFPVRQMAMAKEATMSADTAVEPGNVRVRAVVTLVMALVP